MSYAPVTSLPFSAQVELASLDDGLKRWARLKLLAESAPEPSGPLTRAIEAALPPAEAHAEALAAFYERNTGEVNALVAAATAAESADGVHGRAQTQLSLLGDDPAAALATHARGFIEAQKLESADDGLCDALFNLMLEAYVCCFGGVEASCGTLWGDLYERHCN
ncbi:MAG: hypothetical protein ACTHK3_02905 [Solirubrobacterales bacterium]